ncbi:Carboxypeptidase D [Acipenser ruthenus]|uniref:Carboxypeptidase D n=1 Tax=Acipenser ruthenus TaxID=7906 RepID=A0A444UXI9_ACIRT|nr:Carboxypeptidase D [Acipenser ruthenus]
MQDYNYLKGNCMEITLELTCCKHPPASELPKEWDNNRESLLAYMEKVHIGVKGFVKNSVTSGWISDAEITVSGIDHNVTTGQFGDYIRLLLPGSYNITASAPGRTVVNGEARLKEVPEETYRKYYRYEELTGLLKALAQTHPHIANLSSVGQSVQGRELWVMQITKDPTAEVPGKPKLKYVGNMHGDETVSRQVLVYLIEYLLDRYGKDDRITKLVDEADINIMPSMNPDGFEKSVEGDCEGEHGGRENARGKDLNRSFPDQFETIDVPMEDVPEVAAVMKWIQDKRFVLSGNLHGGSVVASYPFDDSLKHKVTGEYSPSSDDKLFRYLARSYAEHHPLMKTGEPHCPDTPDETFKDGITNGAQWYDVSGKRMYRCSLHGNV